jgi:SOS response regulatory protein OraA/RecX
MKILDLSTAINLEKASLTSNSQTFKLRNGEVSNPPFPKRGSDKVDWVLSIDEGQNGDTEATPTNTARRMFGDKKDIDEKPEKVRDLKNCRGYIIKILGLKDYSSKELFNKALKLGYKTEDIQSILDKLASDNWINDERLAQNLIECYQGRKGKSWLQHKLSMRMIDREMIVKVLSENELVPDDKFKKQVEAKYKVKFGEYIEPKVKQKIISFLARRGFGNVFGVLSEWENGGYNC